MTKPPRPLPRFLKHDELAGVFRVSPSMIDNYIQRYPKGHPNEFPVEYIGRNRRYDFDRVRDWFAAEANDFQDAAKAAA